MLLLPKSHVIANLFSWSTHKLEPGLEQTLSRWQYDEFKYFCEHGCDRGIRHLCIFLVQIRVEPPTAPRLSRFAKGHTSGAAWERPNADRANTPTPRPPLSTLRADLFGQNRSADFALHQSAATSFC